MACRAGKRTDGWWAVGWVVVGTRWVGMGWVGSDARVYGLLLGLCVGRLAVGSQGGQGRGLGGFAVGECYWVGRI